MNKPDHPHDKSEHAHEKAEHHPHDKPDKPEKQPLQSPADIGKPAQPPAEKASFCKPSERAPAGWKRFKIRGRNPSGNYPTKYLIAKNQADAEAEYQKVHVPDWDQKAKDTIHGVDYPWVQLIVTALPD